MRLWILRPRRDVVDDGARSVTDLWAPWYDKTFGVVVRAETDDEARAIASKVAGDEGEAAWLSATFTTCDELVPDGEPGVIMRDFAAA